MEKDLENALKMLDLMCPEQADIIKGAFFKIDRKMAQHEDNIQELQRANTLIESRLYEAESRLNKIVQAICQLPQNL